MKKMKRDDLLPCCALCEYAEYTSESQEALLCTKKKRERQPSDCCRKFVFDLLKYQPARPREMPTLDPSVLELT